MRRFLLDTCVISDGRLPSPNPGLASWLREAPPASLWISVVSVTEVLTGIERLSSGARRRELERWFDSIVSGFRGRVLPADDQLVPAWARVRNSAHRSGNNGGELDFLIAATALHHDLTLITRNERDFAGTGIAILNPWE